MYTAGLLARPAFAYLLVHHETDNGVAEQKLNFRQEKQTAWQTGITVAGTAPDLMRGTAPVFPFDLLRLQTAEEP